MTGATASAPTQILQLSDGRCVRLTPVSDAQRAAVRHQLEQVATPQARGFAMGVAVGLLTKDLPADARAAARAELWDRHPWLRAAGPGVG